MKHNNIQIEDVLYTKTIQAINPYNLGRFNKSTYFLLPMFGHYIGTSGLFRDLLVNIYLDDCEHEHKYIRPLFFLFKTPSFTNIDWINLQKHFKEKSPFADTYLNEYFVGIETKNGKHDFLYMFVFTCPKNYIEDFYKFKQGKYSEFSLEYKKKFPKEARSLGKIVESKIYGAIHKTESLKNFLVSEFLVDKKEEEKFRNLLNTCAELWDKPKPEEEYFNYKNHENTN